MKKEVFEIIKITNSIVNKTEKNEIARTPQTSDRNLNESTPRVIFIHIKLGKF